MDPITVILWCAVGAIALVALAFVIFIVLIAPGHPRDVRAFSSVKFAHRGLHGGTRVENSMSAFSAAIDAGFGIELDVRLSSDGVLVVHHDDELGRVVNGKGRVDSYTAAELCRMHLGDSDDCIPTFDEVLALVDGRVPLLVEIKEDAGSSAVSTAAAQRLSSYTGSYIVESFNPLSLKNFKKILPKTTCGFLSTYFYAKEKFKKPLYFLLQNLLTNRISSPAFIAYDRGYGRRLPLRLARLLGATTFAWTVRSREEELAARRDGFDSVIFEGYIPEK